MNSDMLVERLYIEFYSPEGIPVVESFFFHTGLLIPSAVVELAALGEGETIQYDMLADSPYMIVYCEFQGDLMLETYDASLEFIGASEGSGTLMQYFRRQPAAETDYLYLLLTGMEGGASSVSCSIDALFR